MSDYPDMQQTIMRTSYTLTWDDAAGTSHTAYLDSRCVVVDGEKAVLNHVPDCQCIGLEAGGND